MRWYNLDIGKDCCWNFHLKQFQIKFQGKVPGFIRVNAYHRETFQSWFSLISILLSVRHGKVMQSPEFSIGLAQVTERGLFFYVHMIKYYISKYWSYVFFVSTEITKSNRTNGLYCKKMHRITNMFVELLRVFMFSS